MSAAVPSGPGGAPVQCWNCRQSIPAGSARCLWCGMPQQQGSPQQAVPAGYLGASSGPLPPGPPAPGAPSPAPGAAPQRPGPAAGQIDATRAAVRRAQPTLPAGFAGSPARAGARLGAFTVDVLVIAVVAVAAALLSGRWIFGALAVLEVTVGLWVLQARTGLTAGNALFRLRTSRADAPYSPGVGRGFVRLLVVGVGALFALVGAWVVVASSAFDRAGLGRSWADLAARTLVVRVPERSRSPRQARVPVPQPAVPIAPGTLASAPLVPAAAPQQAPAAMPSLETPPAPAPAPEIAAAPAPEIAPAPAPEIAPAPGAASPPDGTPVVLAGPPAPVASVPAADPPASEGTLLLIFDTGQREQLPTPVTVNLGRNPAQTEPTDRTIAVQDPESTVSKTHLRLEHSRGRTWVTDLGSTNGTDLLEEDGDVVRLAAGTRTVVDDGTRVRVGNRAFTISLLLEGQRSS